MEEAKEDLVVDSAVVVLQEDIQVVQVVANVDPSVVEVIVIANHLEIVTVQQEEKEALSEVTAVEIVEVSLEVDQVLVEVQDQEEILTDQNSLSINS
jgi:hypothetical protein